VLDRNVYINFESTAFGLYFDINEGRGTALGRNCYVTAQGCM
jgi:hypothetical protein